MKRIACLSLLLVLAACSKPQEADAPPAPVAVQPAAPDPWPGKYEGDVMVDVTGFAGAYRAWLLTAKADGCTGDLGVADKGLPARSDGDALEVTVPARDALPQCSIRLTRKGAVVTVTEDAGCASYHGATCAFAGTARRVQPAH
ncbi:hypothetical protein [Asticcacaulis solisilvae]|uniref:hypothetical protein n=1 Tax=Asticcacaulis solisilvae TaxID=1217274 RepID=UPI003FD7F885